MTNEKTFKVRDRRNKGWFYLDNEYLNGYARVFGAIGTAIYLSLCRHADSDQKCFPSERLIAEELNITEKTVRKWLRMLEKWNLISIEKRRSPQGKYQHKFYYLIDKSEWREKPSVEITDGNESTEPSVSEDKNHREVLPTKDTQFKNTQEKKTHSLESFGVFWELYPRKIGKAAALKVWNKIKPDDELIEEILNAVEEQNEWDQWKYPEENGRFIPYPAKWLQDERWTD